MIGTKNNKHLTNTLLAAILSPVAHIGGAGLQSRNVAAQPQTCGFFVRKISVHHVMAGWAEHSQEWPVATPVLQLRSVCHQMIAVVWWRVYNLIRVAIMNTSQSNSAQNSEQNQTKNSISLDDIIKQQDQDRGLIPLPLETELLLKRVADGGHSGQFLADAFISAYRTTTPFQHSLGELIKLDAEGFRIFHQILHIRHVSGWSDSNLYQIEQQIIAIVGGVA